MIDAFNITSDVHNPIIVVKRINSTFRSGDMYTGLALCA